MTPHREQRAMQRNPSARLAVAVLLVMGLSADALGSPDLRTILSKNAFGTVSEEITRRIAKTYNIGDYEKTDLFPCLVGDDPSIALRGVNFTVGLRAFNLTPTDGKLTASTFVTVKGSSKLKAKDLLCVTGNVGCDLRFEAEEIEVRAEVSPTTDGGNVGLVNPVVEVGLEAHNFDLDIGGCGFVGEVAQSVYGIFQDRVVDKLRDELEKIARDEIVDAVAKLLDSFSEIGGQAGDISVAARAIGLPITTDGVGVDAQVTFSTTSQPACVAGERPPAATSTVDPVFKFQGEHIGIAVSQALVQNAMVELWQAGLLCFSGDEESDELGGRFDLKTPQAPVVSLVPGKEARLRVLVPGLELATKGTKTFSSTMDLEIELGLRVDLASAVLIADPDILIKNMQVDAEGDDLLDYKQLLARLVPDLVREKLSDVVLLPRVFHKDGGILGEYFVYISRSETTAQHLVIYAVLTKRPAEDGSPPETEIVGAPAGWAAASTRFVATGVDDKTPTALLRYQWRVDEEAWHEADVSGRFNVKLQGGTHTVSVRAIDLNDNIDPTPAAVTFEVDAVQPTIKITRAPPESVRDYRFVIEFEVEDDRTPKNDITVRVLFERALEDADDRDLTRWEDQTKGISRLKLFALGAGLHTLSLVAVDQAGNTSAPVQLLLDAVVSGGRRDDERAEAPATEGGGGGCCAIDGGRRSSEGALLAGLLLLLLGCRGVRRRRTKRPSVRVRP